MLTGSDISDAFKALTDQVVILAENVNARCQEMKNALTNGGIDVGGTTFEGAGRVIRDYETALEELKGVIQNKCCLVHNDHLKVKIDGGTHAVRGLEVALIHGDGGNEHIITGVVLRGLISACPADGNEAPTYSSKSSSSSVP